MTFMQTVLRLQDTCNTLRQTRALATTGVDGEPAPIDQTAQAEPQAQPQMS